MEKVGINKDGRKLSILIIDDEPDLRSSLVDILESEGYHCEVAESAVQAQDFFVIQNKKYDVVFSDIHMPKMTGIRLLEVLNEKNVVIPPWIFISADVSPESAERACSLGAIDVLEKPFVITDVLAILDRIRSRRANPIQEIMDIVQQISGIQLGPEKRLLVETRLVPRARSVGLTSLEQYFEYFKVHRNEEIKELVSIMTTHTTEFFRESDHFDYLVQYVFPLWKDRTEPVKIWSGACSTGQEVYSLAMCWLEYKLQNPGLYPRLEIYGSDIDFSSVSKAREGIYRADLVKDLDPYIINKYFDVGTDEFLGMVRVKDEVHNLCRFTQANLLSESYPYDNVDVIFLRNILIYFNDKEITKVAQKTYGTLREGGFFFIGHSESLAHLKTPYKVAGNSIYQKDNRKFERAKEAQGLSLSKEKVKVMVVDDSATIRLMLKEILSADEGFEIVAEAENPLVAREQLKSTRPDVMVLDIHMPKMTGIEFLEQEGSRFDFPVVMLSSVSYEDAISVLKCFDLGAVDYLEKPKMQDLKQEAERIRIVLRNAFEMKRNKKHKIKTTIASSKPIPRAKSMPNPMNKGNLGYTSTEASRDLILLGASTGGIEALTEVFLGFPDEIPPVLVVQHIPPNFSKAFAKRIDDMVPFHVKEAENNDVVVANTVYIAPGGAQMKVVMEGSKLVLKITDDSPMNRHKPSVDYLWNSIVDAQLHKRYRLIAALLTGMGADGAHGLKGLHDVKVHTIAQNEETCVVFGMPKVAIDLKAADEILPLHSIAYHLMAYFNRKPIPKAAGG